jgi:Mn2+/Fe2+ NRAMP family transporter
MNSADRAVTKEVPAKGRIVTSRWKRQVLTYLMVMGPGLIVMVADNDAGAVSSYTLAGAQYGTRLLWILILLLPMTYFVQEMVARLGIATGQGHAAMIYKRFGRWWGVFSLADLQLVNFLTLVTEFAAISIALSSMGVSPYLAVPVAAAGLIVIVVTGSYLCWERMVIGLCCLDVVWFALAFACKPSTAGVLHDSIVPGLPCGLNSALVFLIIAIVGTTIAPWQLFFQQSCVADKRLRFADLKWARLDTFTGATFTILVACCMMMVGDLAFRHHIPFTNDSNAAQIANSLGPIAGRFVRNGVLVLMVNCAVLGTTAVSLSSAWAYGEVKGWPHSLRKKVTDAPGFYAVYVLCVAAAAGIVLVLNDRQLQAIILGVQVLAGVMLPSAVIFLQLLLNDRELLGDEFVNKPWNNVVNWAITVVLFGLSLILAAQVLVPKLFPS